MGTAAILKINQPLYLNKGLTDRPKFDKVTHFSPSAPYWPLHFEVFKIQHGDGRHFENRKIATSGLSGLTDRHEI